MKKSHKLAAAIGLVVGSSAAFASNQELPTPPIVRKSDLFKAPQLVVPLPPPTHVVATAYCGCPLCCGKWSDGITASGDPAEQGLTLATDWKVFPKGLCLAFPKLGQRRVQDTGRLIKGNKVDVYFEDHEEALRFGVKLLEVEPC